jgi:DNA mismatch repair ATPase MutS
VIAGRIGAQLAVFRQIAPLVGVAEIVSRINTPLATPLVKPLAEELPRLRRLRMFARWAGRHPGSDELVASLFEYLNLILLLDANAWYFGMRELHARADSLVRVIAAVGEVDAALAVASVRAGTDGWTRPRFLEHGAPILFADVRHPLVANAVPNSIRLAPPHGVLLTGANMSGKSTLLRTVGVNVVLAQTINTCFASDYDAPLIRVRSLMGRSDDLIAGKSYYLVEVEAMVQMLQAAEGDEPCLFLFDELFRGTNAIERIAAAYAVLVHLLTASARPQVVLAATHDGELVELLHGRYEPYHLGDVLGPQGLMFDYRVQPGPTTSRNAIALLQVNGAPPALVRRAQEMAVALEHARRGAPPIPS